jgi:outer membrane lipoprotein-sorting protein
MRTASRFLLASLLLVWAHSAAAQTVDDVVEKCVAALGGRAALGKLTSRSATGTITLSTPGGDLAGSIEVLSQAPNKSRTLIKVDASALGAGMITVDQRFNGVAGYVMDSLQGNSEITGGQLDNMRNAGFPTPLLIYKQAGATATLSGKEKVGDRDAYVVIFEPPSGSIVRQYVDAETYLTLKTVMKVQVPQLGQEVEQTTEFADYRDVDGIKTAFRLTSTSSVQRLSVTITKLEHNVQIDAALFSKP